MSSFCRLAWHAIFWTQFHSSPTNPSLQVVFGPGPTPTIIKTYDGVLQSLMDASFGVKTNEFVSAEHTSSSVAKYGGWVTSCQVKMLK